MGSESLKPCPFCGAPAFLGSTLDNDFYVMCEADECFGMVGYTATAEQAEDNWNRRPPSQGGDHG